MINILQVTPRDAVDHPLLGEQVRLDPRRFRTAVCVLGKRAEGRADNVDLAADALPPVRFLGCAPRRQRWYNLPLVLKLRRVIEREGAHIVHAHLYKPALPVVLAAMMSRGRAPAVIVTIHGLGSARTRGRRLANRFAYPKVDRIVAVCRAVRDDILAAHPFLAPEKVVSIPNGIDYAPFPAALTRREARERIAAAGGEGFWFGAVTRLSRGKNVDTLLRAFDRVARAYPGCTLIVAGDGPERKRLEGLAASPGLKGRVLFLGFRRDVPEILRACDALVHTSLREGIPLALLEAMATGLPVVASQRGGIIEVLGDIGAGILVDPESAGAVARAMTALIDLGPAGRDEMGCKARERALGGFSAQRMVTGLERLYEDVMQRRGTAGVLPDELES